MLPHLALPDHPSIYVVGDAAHAEDADGHPLPAVAQVALQQAEHVAHQLLHPTAPKEPFVYKDRGSMATIGRARAVASIGRWRLSGVLAWVLYDDNKKERSL